MSNLQNTSVLEKQYKNADNLNIRIQFHKKYSTSKIDFNTWISSHYNFTPSHTVLELGCGNCDTWLKNPDLIKIPQTLILSDISNGMIDSAQQNLSKSFVSLPSSVSFKVIDIQNIPYKDNTFDSIIANMMLYHVPNLNQALSEVKRVLKPNGVFYCATFGENGIPEQINALLPSYPITFCNCKTFTLQNGKNTLSQYFSQIKKESFPDSLHITKISDLTDYLFSLQSMTDVKLTQSELTSKLTSISKNGQLDLLKDYGMFICHK